MAVKKMGLLLLILTHSVQLFGVTQQFFKAAVGASAVLSATFSGAKVLQGYSKDGVKLSGDDTKVIAASCTLPLVTYCVLRGRTPAGRLKAVTSEVNKLSKSRLVATPSAPHIQAHVTMPRLLSIQHEGLKYTFALERMHKELAQAHVDATVDHNNKLLNQIEDCQADVKQYQENVAQNLAATRERLESIY